MSQSCGSPVTEHEILGRLTYGCGITAEGKNCVLINGSLSSLATGTGSDQIVGRRDICLTATFKLFIMSSINKENKCRTINCSIIIFHSRCSFRYSPPPLPSLTPFLTVIKLTLQFFNHYICVKNKN